MGNFAWVRLFQFHSSRLLFDSPPKELLCNASLHGSIPSTIAFFLLQRLFLKVLHVLLVLRVDAHICTRVRMYVYT